jgi:hypothetical protein
MVGLAHPRFRLADVTLTRRTSSAAARRRYCRRLHNTNGGAGCGYFPGGIATLRFAI